MYGSSPLSRGIRIRSATSTRRGGIIPALAGNTRLPCSRETQGQDHPRSRGEYYKNTTNTKIDQGSSPLSRGILGKEFPDYAFRGIIPALAGNTHANVRRVDEHLRIIPALAGNTISTTSPVTRIRDHPRSRGEYQQRAMMGANTAGSSPLSRGIRLSVAAASRSGGIIPALAGNTDQDSTTGQHPQDHPRSRGEYATCPGIPNTTTGSSPLSRGIHWVSGDLEAGVGIIPALAGNTAAQLKEEQLIGDHPRSRGEYCVALTSTCFPVGSSPLSRGIHGVVNELGDELRIIPALAGNTTGVHAPVTGKQDHPRSRGEYGQVIIFVTRRFGSSPLSRGIQGLPESIDARFRIIPALAGNTTTSDMVAYDLPDHPRSRGEYLTIPGVQGVHTGSSPLSRGIHMPGIALVRGDGIIPALAGNTSAAFLRLHSPTDHPRSRGEYTIPSATRRSRIGSSPLSRGIPLGRRRLRRPLGIIPALAGNTAAHLLLLHQRGDHPRSRGEYGRASRNRLLLLGSSPLSRGIHTNGDMPGIALGIIPALAGNTRLLEMRVRPARDHPRSRGEYGLSPSAGRVVQGSSPLSRGIHSSYGDWRRIVRIIPALAGNTWPSSAITAQIPDHPRSRGEYFRIPGHVAEHDGSSPLSRGIRRVAARRCARRGIIPALAGNTVAVQPQLLQQPDHPRSRGEYVQLRTGPLTLVGSSPLSRGIPQPPERATEKSGIIPALAGNTEG